MSSAARRIRASGSGQPVFEETRRFCSSLAESDVGRAETLLGLGMVVLDSVDDSGVNGSCRLLPRVRNTSKWFSVACPFT